MITLEQVQKNLSKAIENSGIKQIDIAKQIGVNHSQITYYKQGKKMPALDTFANLCQILDVSADEVLGLK